MTDGRGLAFLNKIQALHCEGFHCKGSSAFIDSQNRYAAKWGKVLGQADHSLPLQDSFAYTHSRKVGKIRKTCPGRVHGYQHHVHSAHNLVTLSSDQADTLRTKPGVIKRTKYFEIEDLNLEHCLSTGAYPLGLETKGDVYW